MLTEKDHSMLPAATNSY